jgi:hypothetical protein
VVGEWCWAGLGLGGCYYELLRHAVALLYCVAQALRCVYLVSTLRWSGSPFSGRGERRGSH